VSLDWLKDYSSLQHAFNHASYAYSEEKLTIERFDRFLTETPSPFSRASLPGHITGSAMVVSPDFRSVLLTLHAKLGLWLQLGGHADDDPNPLQVAMREAEEESGVKDLSAVLQTPFDLDCHFIPAKKVDPSHFHFDIRYLVIADPSHPLEITPESKDLRWLSIEQARTLTQERSMIRQFDKVAWIAQNRNVLR
jgi:8-oxo-dGTP pyrophosphatase MutT (NUDIX family)